MQYWIFFEGGVGGDGFANLLEHAKNVTPSDNELTWRIRNTPHTTKVAFHQTKFANDGRFLRNHSHPDFNLSSVQLTPMYCDLVDQGINTVIPAHPRLYDFDKRFSQWDFLEKDQHKILLYSTDIQRVVDDFCDKNNKSDYQKRAMLARYAYSCPAPYYFSPKLDYKTFINIDKAWCDWGYLQDILISIGISLDRKYYEEYLDISKRRCL